jgi:hypothetical protein
MILKIARYSEDQQWWLLDSIRKISISEPYTHNGIPEGCYDSNAVIFDIKSDCKCNGQNEKCSNCVACYRFICRLEDGSEYTIEFDTLAYILNDNGKTIDKIVANYNESPSDLKK